MTRGAELASIADELEEALAEIGTELEGLRERIGEDPPGPGEGPLYKAVWACRRLSALSEEAK